MVKNEPEFIPAKETPWFIFIFDFYVRNLFWRRFKNVWVDIEYEPESGSRSLYYLNHTSWWDGLIPLLLNQKLFKQKARAMMEDKQMIEHGLFKRVGAFSVNLENPRSAVRSLRYAVESLKRPNSSLFIYPEGKIHPFRTEKLDFRDGLGWITSHLPGLDTVPVGIYIHTAMGDKPELFIRVGKPVPYRSDSKREKLNRLFKDQLSQLLKDLQNDAHSNRHRFQKLI